MQCGMGLSWRSPWPQPSLCAGKQSGLCMKREKKYSGRHGASTAAPVPGKGLWAHPQPCFNPIWGKAQTVLGLGRVRGWQSASNRLDPSLGKHRRGLGEGNKARAIRCQGSSGQGVLGRGPSRSAPQCTVPQRTRAQCRRCWPHAEGLAEFSAGLITIFLLPGQCGPTQWCEPRPHRDQHCSKAEEGERKY